ncbi:MAG: galactokinase [Candidatus Omnitrophica bacterium]|nr:galactokinase [Candidatus Omnitrophota bacterium]
MIITRTPFRITLGGGGTDLPSYYGKRGGFLVTSAIDKYMYVAVNTPFIDRLLRVKYSRSETVKRVSELQHELAREALKQFKIRDALEVVSFADISAGTGMGSSSCYLVGLLNALRVYKKERGSIKSLAELACNIEMRRLKKPIGKQDAYIAAYGGILVMEIDRQGRVATRPAKVAMATVRDLEHNLLLYYSGIQRNTEDVLIDQHTAMRDSQAKTHRAVASSLDHIKRLGRESLGALEKGALRRFGKLMEEHWQFKKRLSGKISNPRIDAVYKAARTKGALGGKVIGAGGGGFLLFYAEHGHDRIEKLMRSNGMKRLDFRFDFEGSKTLLDLADSRIEYQQRMERP